MVMLLIIMKMYVVLYNIHYIIFCAFKINIGIGTVFIYFHWYFKKDNIRSKFSTNTQTTTYKTYKWEM